MELTDLTGGAEVQSELVRGRRLLSTLIVGVFILSSIAGLVTITSPGARAAAPYRVFNIGVVNMQVATYNPLVMTLVDEYIVVYNIYSTLATYDGAYHIRGDLAYNWSVAPDQTNWTFHLVHGAYFTDPTNPGDRSHPVTADDVVFSYNLNMNLSASIFHSYVDTFTAVWYNAADPSTVYMRTPQPFAAMDSAISAIPIFPRYIWGNLANPQNFNNNRNPIGSGAMYYDSVNATFGTNIILRRNPNYYGDTYYCSFSRPDQVNYLDYTSVGAMVNDFKSGTSGLDAIMNIDPPGYLALPASNPANFQKWAVDMGFVGEISLNAMSRQTAATYGYKYLHTDLTLNDTFRRAVAMSINKSGLVKDALLGLGTVADTLVPDSNSWHYSIPANEQFKFDPLAARKMLNDAGWNYTSTGAPATPTTTPLYNLSGVPLSLRFYTLNTADQWKAAADDITAWLSEAGIQTTDAQGRPGYGLYTTGQLGTIWFSGNYDMWLWDWVFTPASDPSLDIMEVETTMAIGPTSDNYYSNPAYDALYNQSLSTMDPVARRQITNTLQSVVYQYASYILPYYRLDLYSATNGRPGVPAGQFPGWTGYGNWTTHPGYVPDSDLPALWAGVEPLDNRPPQLQAMPAVSWVNGSAAPISVTAVDPEGVQLTYNWDFGDGTYLNGTTNAAPTHVYALPGNYTIKVRAMDAEWPVCESTTATISKYTGGPGQNLPPTARADPVATGFQVTNRSITFNLTVHDQEGDPIYVTWAFGDGATATNYVTNTATNQTIHQSHTYATAGPYTVTITYSDNQTGIGSHTNSISLSLDIKAPSGPPGGGGTTPESNPWLNYGVPLAIVAVVVIAVAAVMLRRRSRAKQEEQAGQQPPEGPSPPPPPQ